MLFSCCTTQQRQQISINSRYTSASDRYASFKYAWNMCLKQDPRELSKVGFYYTGVGDKVQCFECGCIVDKWSIYDEPWHRHIIASPNCEFIRKITTSQNVNGTTTKKKKPIITDHDDVDSNDERTMCKICFEREYSTALLPCGHVIACDKCSSTMQICAVCRTKVDKIINVYF